ncbi:hypothetical protein [Caproiciproducens sp.]
MEKPKKPQNPYDVELPQSVIESFARFLVPEIRKFYDNEQVQKKFFEWQERKNEK